MADGDLGSTSNTVEVEVLDRLENFYAENAYANFDVGGDLNLFQIYGSTGPDGTTADGVFEGSLECDTAVALPTTFAPVIRIWGDLHADTTITINDELDEDGSIRIGGDLDGDIVFDQSDGLKGRATINWLDSGGDWNGDITVGSQTLTPTAGDYPETGLGGGAVGLVAYGLHKQACDPVYVGSTWPTFSPTGSCDPLVKKELTIDLVHYGAIGELDGGPDEPFEVTYASGNHCTGPNCFHSSNYVADDADWELDGTNPFPDARTMRIVGQLLPDTHYHIMVNETLECTDVSDKVPTVETKSYVYVIHRADCP